MRSKCQISINFGYHVNSKFLYQTLCAFLQIKDRKHIEQTFHFVARVMSQGWDLVVLVGQNFSVGIGDVAPSSAHSSNNYCVVFNSKIGVWIHLWWWSVVYHLHVRITVTLPSNLVFRKMCPEHIYCTQIWCVDATLDGGVSRLFSCPFDLDL